jgi:autotransporter-associated beta strand protein
MGGAIFVMGGGSLTVGGAITIAGNTVMGGNGASGGITDGRAFGAGLFLQGNGTVRFSPGLGQSEHVVNVIDDQTGLQTKGYMPTSGVPLPGSYKLVKSGPGTLFLSADNSYSGGTTLKAGKLELTALSAAGTGAITFTGKATLAITNAAFPSHVFANPIVAFAKSDALDLTGLHFHSSAKASFDATSHSLTVDSGGIKDMFTLHSPKGTHFAVANDGHGGTLVTLHPPFTASLASAALHDLGEQHWTADSAGGTHAMGDYLIVG